MTPEHFATVAWLAAFVATVTIFIHRRTGMALCAAVIGAVILQGLPT